MHVYYEKDPIELNVKEDCTESWVAVRAKALYYSDIFPPGMIIHTMGILVEAFP